MQRQPKILAATLRTATLFTAALFTATLFTAPALAQGSRGTEKARIEVVADRTAYEPGTTVRLAARVEIDKGWHVNSNTPSYDYLIPTALSLELAEGGVEPSVTYPAHKLEKFAFTEEPIAVYEGGFAILAEFEIPADAEGLLGVAASLRYQACDDQQCLAPTTARAELDLTVGPGGQPANERVFQLALAGGGAADEAVPAEAVGTAAADAPGLAWILLLAMAGGLLLNAMPCVLPVLSLKVFGLVKSGGLGRSHLVVGSFATVAGVLVSFWALAGAAVGMKWAGEAVGWGMQFQQPGFVTFLTVVVVLFSLNMWGVFEIRMPSSVMAVSGGAGMREGIFGHFLSGLFATLMATPCSAPFLGTAVGFALAQSTLLIFAIFTAIGLGLALPYLLLAAFPAAARLLPRPGEWMVTFRHVMGFLLAATAVWLFYVLAAQVSTEYLAFIQLAVLGLALCTWFFQRAEGKPFGRRFASVGIFAAVVLAVALAMQSPAPAVAAGGTEASAHHDWLAFDEAEAQRLAENEGRLVFVDFTADWCLTCKANERLVIETSEIADAFEKHRVVTMKGDWTNRDDTITAYLARYGRAAVPFYVLYRPDQEPHAFGELLTKQTILDVLDETGAVAALP